MGTINYKTSNYITLGYNTNNIDYDNYNDEMLYIEDVYDNLKNFVLSQNFYYFYITIEPGYYEGFSLFIEFNFSFCLDSYYDKILAQKEITQIKHFLKQCINDFDVVACSPGWCTAFYSYKESLKKLDDAIKEMRDTVKNTPTYKTVKIAGEIW